MTLPEKLRFSCHTLLLGAFLFFQATPSEALESDRQQPLEVHADSTDGTLGDGMTVLNGKVDIRQGSLLVQADVAELEKVDGRVRRVILQGTPVLLQQEIEEQGLVSARAGKIEYEVATGIITLTGDADVNHPQYKVKGEMLVYDMNLQHFQGSGGDGNGRLRIQLDPEVVPEVDALKKGSAEPGPNQPTQSESERSPETDKDELINDGSSEENSADESNE
jgi:lipopolysaccharide export system protein LptA